MKHILIILFSVITLSAFGQAGSYSLSVMRSRVNDSTSVVPSDASGYGSMYWNNQATNPGWRVWVDGVGYVIWDPTASGSGWATTGTTNVTSPTINFGAGTVLFQGTSGGSFYAILPAGGTGNLGFSLDDNSVGFGIDAGDNVSRMFSDSEAKLLELDPTGVHITTDDPLTINADPGTAGYVLQSNGAGAAPTWVAPSGGGFVSPTALTDGSSISITSTNNTLTTTQSAITFSDGWTGNYSDVSVTFNQTSATWTFPAGALCVVEGVASGDNTAAVTGVSGDKIELSIRDINGTNYRVVIKNFGQ